MKTIDIINAIGKMQVLKFHSPVCKNIAAGFHEMDVMSISKSGMIYEFEVKVSRSDFMAEKLKTTKWHLQEIQVDPNCIYKSCPNYFSYACPDGLIKESDLKEHMGLYYVLENGSVKEIRPPKKIHRQLHNLNKIYEKVCRTNSEREFLGMARLTYENKLIRERYS